MIKTIPKTKMYCGINDLLFNDQTEQLSARIAIGPNIFTPNIA